MIYFIRNGKDGAVKIGYVAQEEKLPRRLSNLQLGTPFAIHQLGVMDGDMDTEKELHERFRGYYIRGEWFRPHNSILEFVEENARESLVRYAPSKKTRAKTTPLTIRIDTEVKERLNDKAIELGVSLQQLIRWILEDAAQKPAIDLLPVPMSEAEQE